MKTLRLFFSLLVFAPVLPACSSADATSESSEAPAPSAIGETHADNIARCDSRRRQLQGIACANYNAGLSTCAKQCLNVNPLTCALVIDFPDSSTACNGRLDCHNHVCDGAGSCSIPTTRVDDHTYCDTGPCSTYGASECTAGACGAPTCYWPGGECETRVGSPCSTQPVCKSMPSCY